MASHSQARTVRTRVPAAARLSRVCAVFLFSLGLFWAASATASGTVIALFGFTSAMWCWQHQRRLRRQP